MYSRRQLFALMVALFSAWTAPADELPELGGDLTPQQVTLFSELALRNIDTEFPNKPSNVMEGPEWVLSPKQMHPAFYGCFDWHSSVHGHWMLVRIKRGQASFCARRPARKKKGLTPYSEKRDLTPYSA